MTVETIVAPTSAVTTHGGSVVIPPGSHEPEPEVKYDFDDAFQKKIAALVCRDTTFVQRVDGLIRPEYFESDVDAALVSMALRYYEKYKKVPADPSIYVRLIKDDLAAKILSRDLKVYVVQRLKELYKTDISDRDYVVDQVATFSRHQAVQAAILESVPKLEQHKFTEIASLLQKALNVGANLDVGEYDYGSMIEARTGERLERAAGMLPPTGITTGYPYIDDALYHKGWGRRELSVLMGGAKAGKTMALITFGINAVAAGYNVIYFTLEVSSRIIAERLDANIADCVVSELGDHVHDVRSKVQAFMAKAGKRFVIQEFPTGSLRVSDVRRVLERYKAKGTKFDLVIVDYADLMAPERMTDNSMENSKSVYVNLRGLAMEEDVAILTATQTNRDGFKAAVARAEHVADDFNKIRIADVVISINKTEEEAKAKRARLFFAAVRNSASGFTIMIEQDIDRAKFITKVIGSE